MKRQASTEDKFFVKKPRAEDSAAPTSISTVPAPTPELVPEPEREHRLSLPGGS